ncbi:MAG: DUF368 domain-containing protein [Cyclobacteriaceae bacterium]|nr:DUF368 domain-containing protein [Cyclobacteriaceae bacterium]
MGKLFLLFLKGMAMGAANVIPGVSGGTIAFITGIYEEFISALKSFDLKAVKLLLGFKLKDFADHVNLRFLIILLSGVMASLLSLGKLLAYLFVAYPVFVWAFFFGLIAISIFSVGRTIKQWNFQVILWFVVGAAVALLLALMKPAQENTTFIYLALCGLVAIASMILPGLSGSFVLILMGNYQLIMLRAIPGLDLSVIVPVALGCIVGFVLLSHSISFLLNRYHDHTVSTLTGFILGSLTIIWPWKNELLLLGEDGNPVLKNGNKIVEGYEWFVPAMNMHTLLAVVFILAGIFLVYTIEKLATPKQ